MASSASPAFLGGGISSTSPSFLSGQSNKRVTNIGLSVEYKPATNQRRVTNAGLSIEYKPATNRRRVTNAGLSVEYLSGALQLPQSDAAVNEWENELGGAILYTSITGAVVTDGTYVTKDTPQVGDYFEVNLADLGPELVGTGEHTLEFRGWATAGQTFSVKAELCKGAQVIASNEQVLTTSAANYIYTLTDQEIDAIIDDYDLLKVRITIIGIS